MKNRPRPISFLLVLLLLFPLFCPLPALAAEDQVIRVLLTRPALTDRVEISLDGSYTVDDLAFQRGSLVTVSCASGKLMVYYEGISFEHGTSLRFVRHPLSGDDPLENGLRIDHAYPLHPGDLLLTIRDGMLRAVLYIDVEEYLCGVLPYEMSDTYPLEALKAQAVASRTYALNKKQSSEQDYDVTDNTNDQVYAGIQKEHVTSRRAVTETARLCLIAEDGTYARCYYCASNGGQTETVSRVWGSADLPYLTARNDPYDLENPYSTCCTYTIGKTGPWDASFTGIVSPLADNALTARLIDPEGARWLSVDRAEMVSPSWPGSLLYTGLQLEITVEYPSAETEEEVYFHSEATAAPSAEASGVLLCTASVSVTVPVFPALADACGLRINPGSGNELVSVKETEDAFVVQSRRYGHGVGMSQRGAQWMAQKYGMDHLQILAFYYPGLRIERKLPDVSLPSVTAVSMDFLATPGPAASPTPRPTLMPVEKVRTADAHMVAVTNISENSYLNLRALPSTNSPVICQLYFGQLLLVEGETEGEWLHVRTDTVEGYVYASYVQEASVTPSPQ